MIISALHVSCRKPCYSQTGQWLDVHVVCSAVHEVWCSCIIIIINNNNSNTNNNNDTNNNNNIIIITTLHVPCRKPATIRLGSIAKLLPPEARQVVADAVAYDAPASGESTDRKHFEPSPGYGSPAAPGGSEPMSGVNRGPHETAGSQQPTGNGLLPAANQKTPRGSSSSPYGGPVSRLPGGSTPLGASSQPAPGLSRSPREEAGGRLTGGSSVPGWVSGGGMTGGSSPSDSTRLASQRVSWAATDTVEASQSDAGKC